MSESCDRKLKVSDLKVSAVQKGKSSQFISKWVELVI